MKCPFQNLFAALLFALPIAAQTAGGDRLALGKMWTFSNPPLGYLEREYGFKPDQKWLDSLRLAALRLGELGNPWCSASFVSPQGLILTNHHCIREQLPAIQGEDDWVKDGFAATDLTDEVPIPGLCVQQLVGMEDVSKRVDAGIETGDDDATVARKRAENIEQIETAANEADGAFHHQVVALYQGAVHHLYRYRVYDDIRLVLAVELQAAHFGGDADNFTFPRWSIDFSFLRAYENGVPADTKAHYFRWRKAGAREGELVFVPGNPGSTNRLFTKAQLESQREVDLPLQVEQLEKGIEALRPYTAANPGLLAIQLNWENGRKSLAGTLAGLRDTELLAKKAAHEQAFRAAVAADPQLQTRFGSLWDELADLAKRRAALLPKVLFYSASYSSILERGLAMARALDPQLDEEERDQAREQALGMAIGGNALTDALLLDHFERAARWLPATDPYLAVIGGLPKTDGPRSWPASLDALASSKLADDDFVAGLLDANDAKQQFASADDCGVAAGRMLYPLLEAVGKENQELEAAIAARSTKIGQALHAVFGTDTSPDATMTLRFSDGLVQGYPYNGTLAPWATTFYGLLGRTHEFGGMAPFDLASGWAKAAPRFDLQKRVCFVSTNDIVGGNSGSSVVDRELQVVGLIFDGNIESLANDFYYTQQRARAVSVHTDAIVEGLRKVYGMQRLLEELGLDK